MVESLFFCEVGVFSQEVIRSFFFFFIKGEQSYNRLVLQLFYSATVVEMAPVAQTNIEFYESAHFIIKKLPLFIKTTPLL